MKKNQVFRTIITIIATAIVTFTVTMLYCYTGNLKTQSLAENLGTAFNSDKLATKISLIKSRIESDYIGDVDENQLMEGAIKGYVAGLNDEYSQYYSEKEMTEVSEATTGKYVGIGVYLVKDTENNEIVIYGTLKNSPAEEANLQTGDVITSVDGTACNGDDFDNIVDSIRGKEGSKVKITIKRNEESKEYELERRNIVQIRVDSQMLENNIGYIYISSFDGDVKSQFKEEYDKLKSQGATSLIIDLRNNGGGIVNEAIGIAEFFTDKGQNLLIEADKNGKETITKSKNDKEITMNTVLLINGYSASASEILAGVMKESVDNATVIGSKTYGKGVIQALYQLSDGSGLKLTTDEYFTPNKNKINKVGISPDINVDDYTFNGILDTTNDTQLKKAIETLTSK